MITTTDKEKEQLITANYTPLKKEFFLGREEVNETIDSPIKIENVNDEGVISPEVMPYIVTRPDQILMTPELYEAGLETNKVTLPLPEEKIKIGLKEKIGSSFRWFAELLKRRMLLKPRTA